MRHAESKIQIAAVRWFRLQHAAIARLLVSIPNGGLRGRSEAAIMKAEGIVAGAADLLLLCPSADRKYGFLAIEMKTEKGRQADTQKAWQKTVEERSGGRYCICRSVDDFRREVNEHLRVKFSDE